jgi:hypothetical protein
VTAAVAVTEEIARWIRDETVVRYGWGRFAPIWTGVAFLRDKAEVDAVRLSMEARGVASVSPTELRYDRRIVALVVASEARVIDVIGAADWWTTCQPEIPTPVLAWLHDVRRPDRIK